MNYAVANLACGYSSFTTNLLHLLTSKFHCFITLSIEEAFPLCRPGMRDLMAIAPTCYIQSNQKMIAKMECLHRRIW